MSTHGIEVRLAAITIETDAGSLPGVAFHLRSTLDQPIPFGNLFIVRKGINALPEFANGFDVAADDVIPGLEPERYQIRVQIPMLDENREMSYLDDGEVMYVGAGQVVTHLLPMIFAGAHYFLQAPSGDVSLRMLYADGDEVVLKDEGIVGLFRGVAIANPNSATDFVVRTTIKVPKQGLGDSFGPQGDTNINPIEPMPNN